jgi:hypothetical protein
MISGVLRDGDLIQRCTPNSGIRNRPIRRGPAAASNHSGSADYSLKGRVWMICGFESAKGCFSAARHKSGMPDDRKHKGQLGP